MPVTRKISKLNIHFCESDDVAVCNFDNIKHWHTVGVGSGVWYNGRWRRGLGMRDIGYHFFIDRKGKCTQGRRVELQWKSADSIDICVGFRDTWSSQCLNELISLIRNLCVLFNLNPLTCIYISPGSVFNLRQLIDFHFKQIGIT